MTGHRQEIAVFETNIDNLIIKQKDHPHPQCRYFCMKVCLSHVCFIIDIPWNVDVRGWDWARKRNFSHDCSMEILGITFVLQKFKHKQKSTYIYIKNQFIFIPIASKPQ